MKFVVKFVGEHQLMVLFYHFKPEVPTGSDHILE